VVEGFDPTPASLLTTPPEPRPGAPRPPRGDHLSDRSMW